MKKIDEEYLKYITEEFKLYTNKNIDIPDTEPDTLLNLILKKRKVQAKKIANFTTRNATMRNTNMNNGIIKCGDFEFDYEYQRYNMKIRQKNFLQFFYNYNSEKYDFVYTNCGMSALYTCFTAFNRLGYKIERQGHIYVEIERMLDDYTQNPDNFSKKVAYIDTTNYTPVLDLVKSTNLSEYDAFIFDTTDYMSDEILPIISELNKYKKMICLIRSHIKLDMLGAEWSKLGSICILNEYDEPIFKKLYSEFEIILSIIGGFAYPEDIPLMWNNKKFMQVNKKRIEIIKRNSQYLYDELLKYLKKEEMVYPCHKKFILLKINNKYAVSDLNKRLGEYIDNLKYKGLINLSDSFGLDFYAINGYWESMNPIYPVIRISVPDFSKNTNEVVVKELVDMIKKVKKEMMQ